MDLINRRDCPPFITADGSEIRELMAYRNAPGIRHQSLAEATLKPGRSTTEHYHPKAEELYYILKGSGLMQVDGVLKPVGPGDTIGIPPGLRHKLTNTGPDDLVLLCCCSPAYEHSDTILTE